MVDFGYLAELEVSLERTQEYPLSRIMVGGLVPVLLLAPATDANKPYYQALLHRANKVARMSRTGGVSADVLEESRDEDRGLYPKYVVKGWRNVADASGKLVVFSVPNCEDFLRALPNWVFDDVRTFCGTPANFVDYVNVEVIAKK